MTLQAPPPTLTVSELRQRWEPHKVKLNGNGSGNPTSVRFHRACSWLEEAEQFNTHSHGTADDHCDHALLFRWTAFNAMYGQWNAARHEPLPDRMSWQHFLTRMLDLDSNQHTVSLLKKQRGLVQAIMQNPYLNDYFWENPCSEKARRTKQKGVFAVQVEYAKKEWSILLEEVVDRIYLLRCQLTHGAATLRSRMNREAVTSCATLLGLLVPTFLLVWIDNGADEDWGIMCYPPLHQEADPIHPRRPR